MECVDMFGWPRAVTLLGLFACFVGVAWAFAWGTSR